MNWKTIDRPGYFGRKRDQKIMQYNTEYGIGNWRLVWIVGDEAYEFEDACKRFYEESYYCYLKDRSAEVAFICEFAECIDNAASNVLSGLDYTKQEAFSTHIQDISVRNVLVRLGRKFEGKRQELLIIRSKNDNGYRFGPGNMPFFDRRLITSPPIRPSWANAGSVEEFWQSNKNLQARMA